MRYLILLILFFSASSQSALYQCKNNNGEVEFKDTPCSQGVKEKVLEADYDSRGFYKKYFQKPSHYKYQAKCVSNTCYCNSSKITFSKSEENILFKSAENIPYVWRKYQNTLNGFGGMSTRRREETAQYACELMLYQKMFNKYYHVYSDRVVETKSKKDKIKGNAIECGTKPIIGERESTETFRRRYQVYENCLKRKSFNYSYKNSSRAYHDSKKKLYRLDAAISELRELP